MFADHYPFLVMNCQVGTLGLVGFKLIRRRIKEWGRSQPYQLKNHIKSSGRTNLHYKLFGYRINIDEHVVILRKKMMNRLVEIEF